MESPAYSVITITNVLLVYFSQMSEYRSAQEEAKKDHRFIWQYGDITEDDAKEFGR